MLAGARNVPMKWATCHEEVDLEDPTSLLDQVHLCTQRAAQVNNRIVMEKPNLVSKLISTSTDVKNGGENPKEITVWSYDMEGLSQKCVDQESVGNLSEPCSQTVFDVLVFWQDLEDERYFGQ